MEIEIIDVRMKPLWQRIRITVLLLAARVLRVPIRVDESALADHDNNEVCSD